MCWCACEQHLCLCRMLCIMKRKRENMIKVDMRLYRSRKQHYIYIYLCVCLTRERKSVYVRAFSNLNVPCALNIECNYCLASYRRTNNLSNVVIRQSARQQTLKNLNNFKKCLLKISA